MAAKDKQPPSQQRQVVVPAVGESVHEGLVQRWLKEQGDYVRLDETLVELETDKATVEIVADVAGILNIQKPAGTKVTVGETLATITAAPEPTDSESVASEPTASKPQSSPSTTTSEPAAHSPTDASETSAAHDARGKLSPAVRRMLAESPEIDLNARTGSGKDGRLLKQDLTASRQEHAASGVQSNVVTTTANQDTASTTRREPMSMVRRRIASRLVAAKNATAMLTTFNEINMAQVIAYRQQYKESFKDKHGVTLGFMGFFALACTEALREFPPLNAFVIEDEIEYHDHVNLGVAVSTDRGLLVPVIKQAQNMSLVDMELQIAAFAQIAR
ncbi:MAG: 2-oxo acid dehydrogenase subunit E2, partial [Pseudomonadota bacterium]|nr:2-oxo acid dehydrogenase subunit E2 [Pseudomonadota bacterium]